MIDPFVSADWLRDPQRRGDRRRCALVPGRSLGARRVRGRAHPRRRVRGARHGAARSRTRTTAAGGTRWPRPSVSPAASPASGIGDGDTVIAYDDAGGVIAARLVWMLRAIGHEAALLDGGLAAWPAEDLHTGAHGARPPASFTPGPVAARAADEDRRGRARPSGADRRARRRALRRRRAGSRRPALRPHPRRPQRPAREHLDAAGRIATPSASGAASRRPASNPGTPVVSYCGSGVTACHNLLALERAGLGPGRLFPGSWSQWSRDPDRPVATGADHG